MQNFTTLIYTMMSRETNHMVKYQSAYRQLCSESKWLSKIWEAPIEKWPAGPQIVEAVSTSSLLDLLLLLLLLPPPSPPTTNELAEKSLISVQQPQEGSNETNQCGSEPDQELSLALDGKSWQGPTRGCHASQIQSHHLPPYKCLLRCCLTLPTSCHPENPVARENQYFRCIEIQVSLVEHGNLRNIY